MSTGADCLRLTADFDNFKKRAARERQEAIKFANQSTPRELILVLDRFRHGACRDQQLSSRERRFVACWNRPHL